MKFKSILMVALAVPVLTISLPLRAQDPLAAKVDSLFSKYNDAPGPGLALVVVKDGKVLIQKGYGLANLEYEVPIDPSTVFDIASLSKQFTGFAVSSLIEQGLIRPEDNIRKYIPELPDFGETITISHLLHHTSGIRDWCAAMALAGWNMQDVISYDQILNLSYHQKDLNFVPGAEHLYSNTGYNLLAELVHRVTGKTLREWADANLFGPLGMKNTHFWDDCTEVIPNRAYGYYEEEGRYHGALDNLTAVGSSSLFSCVDDLSKWLINLDQPKVGSRAIIDRMVQPGMLNNGSPVAYGYGLLKTIYRGVTEITHDGSWAAFTTYLAYYPEEHLGIAVLSNGSARVKRATHDLADLCLQHAGQPAAATVPAPQASAQAVPDMHPEEFAGTYYSEELQTRYEILEEKGQLIAVHFRNGRIALAPAGNDQFTGDAWFMQTVRFYRNSKGRVEGFLVTADRCRNQRFVIQ